MAVIAEVIEEDEASGVQLVISPRHVQSTALIILVITGLVLRYDSLNQYWMFIATSVVNGYFSSFAVDCFPSWVQFCFVDLLVLYNNKKM